MTPEDLTTTDFHISKNLPPADRVLAAATHLLLERGRHGMRSAEIAQVASTTETTVFRHFGTLPGVIEATYRRACATVNTAIASHNFKTAWTDDPTGALLGDTAAIWAMRDDPETYEAALVAFMFFRRRVEILSDASEPCEEQEELEARFRRFAAAIVARWPQSDADDSYVDGAEHAAQLLTTMLLNYIATIWLTWHCMPVGTSDWTERDHDLSAAEAQMGVLSSIEVVKKSVVGNAKPL